MYVQQTTNYCNLNYLHTVKSHEFLFSGVGGHQGVNATRFYDMFLAASSTGEYDKVSQGEQIHERLSDRCWCYSVCTWHAPRLPLVCIGYRLAAAACFLQVFLRIIFTSSLEILTWRQ